VSPLRWFGIALISGGVGFVAGGPMLTSHPEQVLRVGAKPATLSSGLES
jgi:hypothetical protein